jgi:hypothetical protein
LSASSTALTWCVTRGKKGSLSARFPAHSANYSDLIICAQAVNVCAMRVYSGAFVCACVRARTVGVMSQRGRAHARGHGSPCRSCRGCFRSWPCSFAATRQGPTSTFSCPTAPPSQQPVPPSHARHVESSATSDRGAKTFSSKRTKHSDKTKWLRLQKTSSTVCEDFNVLEHGRTAVCEWVAT